MWGLVCWVCNRHLVVGYHMGFVESFELGMWNLGFGVCVRVWEVSGVES